ncbi:MAG: FtsX-like permease family protein [Candidatus Zixiibacteriota bacterium]
MLKNYIKIALKVLLRRKFFTFVSLFGTGFTLLVLMVAAAFVNQILTPARPGSRFDRTLFIERIEIESEKMHVSSLPSYYYLNKYVAPMSTPEAVSIHSREGDINVYVGSQKLTLGLKYTDANFWYIVELPFLYGRPYDENMVNNADMVAVITDRTNKEIFGDESGVGKTVESTAGNFRIVGIIPAEDIPTKESSGDIFVPITTSASHMTGTRLFSSCNALILAPDESSFNAIYQEYDRRLDQAREDYKGEFDKVECFLRTQTDRIVAGIMGEDASGGTFLLAVELIGVAILFMLLPAINLININVSRIIERSSEIGVRKAFGASSKVLLGQFIIENVFLTLLAGALSFILAWIVLIVINASGVLPFGQLIMNIKVFFAGLILSLFFGVFSGVIPAYRMSRLHPVKALRGGVS